MRTRRLAAVFLLTVFLATLGVSRGDGPRDNVPGSVRPIPAKGVDLPDAVRSELQTDLDALEATIKKIKAQGYASTRYYVPDVEIFHKAVHDALVHHEFLNEDFIRRARLLLKQGKERAEQLESGKAPWTTATGLVVRGYTSRIDGSVQPYGLWIPESYKAEGERKHPLNLWFHGRDEELTEIKFLTDRQTNRPDFMPPDTIVLLPFERYCNAGKFAGEIDVLEALDSVKHRYRIDEDRIAERGFSMGGAAAWHFAVHYPSHWAAANPGAGFAETPDFLKVFQSESLDPPEYERKLWHMYDCTDWAANLYNCPTVAYSGELDTQRQAAEIMSKAMEREGLKLTHIIGPGAHHNFEPQAKQQVAALVDELVAKGRPKLPRKLRFTTYTLKYNRQYWLTVDALAEHWTRADIEAELSDDGKKLNVTTRGVAAFSVSLPGAAAEPELAVIVNGKPIAVDLLRGGAITLHFRRGADGQTFETGLPAETLRKKNDLQGPIDDAFLDSFVMVRPTGNGSRPQVDKWAQAEMERAIAEWRHHFRGDARVKKDSEIADADIANANLVLWGTPETNSMLKRIAGDLPIRWDGDKIVVSNKSYDAATHAPILIYPNPLNPERYVVLNSGFTYREYDYLNNARQTPKLPDWAIVDVTVPPDTRHPGKIEAADFFDEKWRLKN